MKMTKIKYLNLDKDIIETDLNLVRVFDCTYGGNQVKIVYDYKTKDFVGVAVSNDNIDYIRSIVEKICNNTITVPVDLIEFRKKCPERRTLSMNVHKAGGSSGKNTLKTSLYIPTSWSKELDVMDNERELEVLFFGDRIVIRKNKNSQK